MQLSVQRSKCTFWIIQPFTELPFPPVQSLSNKGIIGSFCLLQKTPLAFNTFNRKRVSEASRTRSTTTPLTKKNTTGERQTERWAGGWGRGQREQKEDGRGGGGTDAAQRCGRVCLTSPWQPDTPPRRLRAVITCIAARATEREAAGEENRRVWRYHFPPPTALH